MSGTSIFGKDCHEHASRRRDQYHHSQAANVIQKSLQEWYASQIHTVDREVNRLSQASSDLILWVVASALVAFVLIGNLLGLMQLVESKGSFPTGAAERAHASYSARVFVDAVTDRNYENRSAAGTLFSSTGYDTSWNPIVGAGLEYGFAPNWSVGVEYNHIFEGRHVATFCTPAGIAIPSFNTGGDTDMVLGRLNYKFSGPVVARY